MFLIRDLICKARFELDFGPLERAKEWCFGWVERLRDHIAGGRRLDPLRREKLHGIAGEYRILWEGVWVGYMKDEIAARIRAQVADGAGDHDTP